MGEPPRPRRLRTLCGCLLALLLWSDADGSSTGVRSDLTGDQAVARAHAVRATAGRPVLCDADLFALPTPTIAVCRAATNSVQTAARHPAPEPDTRRAPAPHPARAPPAS